MKVTLVAVVVLIMLASPILCTSGGATPLVSTAVPVNLWCEMLDYLGAYSSHVMVGMCALEIIWDNQLFDEWMERK